MIKFVNCLIIGDEKDFFIKSSRMLFVKSTLNFYYIYQFLFLENVELKLYLNLIYVGLLLVNVSFLDFLREKMVKVDDFINVLMKMSVIFCMCSLMYKYFIVIDWNKVQNFFCCMYMKNINIILSNVNCWYKSEVYFSKKKK